MPLLRAAVPRSGDIRNDRKSRVSINSERIAVPVIGGVGRVVGFLPAIVEFHEAGILDAVRLRCR